MTKYSPRHAQSGKPRILAHRLVSVKTTEPAFMPYRMGGVTREDHEQIGEIPLGKFHYFAGLTRSHTLAAVFIGSNPLKMRQKVKYYILGRCM